MPCTAAAEFYAITTDCWTSHAIEAYIGVTFHTITNEWQLQHFVLENKELPEQHTAENVAEAVEYSAAMETRSIQALLHHC